MTPGNVRTRSITGRALRGLVASRCLEIPAMSGSVSCFAGVRDLVSQSPNFSVS